MGVVSCSQWSGACLSMPPQNKMHQDSGPQQDTIFSLLKRGQNSSLQDCSSIPCIVFV